MKREDILNILNQKFLKTVHIRTRFTKYFSTTVRNFQKDRVHLDDRKLHSYTWSEMIYWRGSNASD